MDPREFFVVTLYCFVTGRPTAAVTVKGRVIAIVAAAQRIAGLVAMQASVRFGVQTDVVVVAARE